MTPQVEAIVLAAGESTRMGGPKALLDWDGRPLVAFQVAELLSAGVSRVILVVGHEAGAVRAAVESAGFESGALHLVDNPHYHSSKASSVRAGAVAILPDSTAVLVLGVDQPRPAGVIRALLLAHEGSPEAIHVPARAGRRGHPVLVPARLFGELASVDDTTLGLRALMTRHAGDVQEVEFTSNVVLTDLNDPDAYEATRASWLREM